MQQSATLAVQITTAMQKTGLACSKHHKCNTNMSLPCSVKLSGFKTVEMKQQHELHDGIAGE
jgi:hypothetical protein